MKKIIFLTIFTIFFFFVQSLNSFALDNKNKIYDEQLQISKANTLIESLPKDVTEDLNSIGIKSVDWNDILSIKGKDLIKKIFDTIALKSPKVLGTLSFIIAIILLTALISGFENSFNKKSLGGVISIISNLCISMTIVTPVCKLIENASFVISSVSKLLVCYVPIMCGIMVASGQNISAFSYSSIMIILGNIYTQISKYLLIPFLNCFLALSLSTSLSTKLNLSSLNACFLKFTKWVLSFIVSIFFGTLSIKSIVGNTADSFNNKTMKFLLSGCVPIVGSTLGDAFSTVKGCVNLLKSGVGAFFILAIFFIFLPIILECSIWIISINLCNSFGEIFGLGKVIKILKNVLDVLKILLAVIISLLIILVVSTVIILYCGGN